MNEMIVLKYFVMMLIEYIYFKVVVLCISEYDVDLFVLENMKIIKFC